MLTTNGKVVRISNGDAKGVKRIRYICYNKTRKHMECDGQTGYTMHIVDEAVEAIFMKTLSMLAGMDNPDAINDFQGERIRDLELKLNIAQLKKEKAYADYSAVKQKVKESINGTSQIPSGLLDSLADDAYHLLLQAEDEYRYLSCEFSEAKEHISEITKIYNSIRIWSRIFDISSSEAKKMIISSVIQRVEISRGYKINIIYSDVIQKMMKVLE